MLHHLAASDESWHYFQKKPSGFSTLKEPKQPALRGRLRMMSIMGSPSCKTCTSPTSISWLLSASRRPGCSDCKESKQIPWCDSCCGSRLAPKRVQHRNTRTSAAASSRQKTWEASARARLGQVGCCLGASCWHWERHKPRWGAEGERVVAGKRAMCSNTSAPTRFCACSPGEGG